MEALAELGLALREEIYAGNLEALEVMSHYLCRDSLAQWVTVTCRQNACLHFRTGVTTRT
jgi:hypothetical protein